MPKLFTRVKVLLHDSLKLIALYSIDYCPFLCTGKTEDAVILNLGDVERAPGLSYVAMSRVKSLDGLTFQPMPTYERLTKFKERKFVKERLAEDSRLDDLEKKTLTWIEQTLASSEIEIDSDSQNWDTNEQVLSDEEFFSVEEESDN